MPVFEYQCRSCGMIFEKLVRSAQDAPRACRKCGAEGMDKIPSVFGMHFKAVDGGAHSSGGCGGCRRTSCAGCKS